MQAAVKHAVRILAAGSPSKISTLHSNRCQFELNGRVCDGTGKDEAAEAELEAYIADTDKRGIHSNSIGIFSAHQMVLAKLMRLALWLHTLLLIQS